MLYCCILTFFRTSFLVFLSILLRRLVFIEPVDYVLQPLDPVQPVTQPRHLQPLVLTQQNLLRSRELLQFLGQVLLLAEERAINSPSWRSQVPGKVGTLQVLRTARILSCVLLVLFVLDVRVRVRRVHVDLQLLGRALQGRT